MSRGVVGGGGGARVCSGQPMSGVAWVVGYAVYSTQYHM